MLCTRHSSRCSGRGEPFLAAGTRSRRRMLACDDFALLFLAPARRAVGSLCASLLCNSIPDMKFRRVFFRARSRGSSSSSCYSWACVCHTCARAACCASSKSRHIAKIFDLLLLYIRIHVKSLQRVRCVGAQTLAGVPVLLSLLPWLMRFLYTYLVQRCPVFPRAGRQTASASFYVDPGLDWC